MLTNRIMYKDAARGILNIINGKNFNNCRTKIDIVSKLPNTIKEDSASKAITCLNKVYFIFNRDVNSAS